ncbi:MAG: M20/M25/M40 family metallo-hydrolase [Acidobacteriota bacterium]
MKTKFSVCLLLLCLALPAENVELNVVHRIKNEAFQSSKVMDHVFYLTDVHGPRLAGSPGYKAAADWVVATAKEWGLENVKLEKWGEVGRGWSHSRFAAHIVAPVEIPLIGFPLAWTPGTNGPVIGDAVLAPIRNEADFAKYKGTLKGKIVLLEGARDLQVRTTADSQRYTEAELAERAKAPDPALRSPFGMPFPRPGGPQPSPQFREMMEARQFRTKLGQLLKEEGVLAVISPGQRGDMGTVFAASGGSRDLKDPLPPPSIALAVEHYNRIVRLLEKKMPVKLEVDVRVRIEEKPVDGFNVIAELRGDRKKDELVMIGAHLDSWHGGTGATDDAAGCAVMMEAMRILKKLGLKTDRTVRMALWDAEEQGLLGSRAYVKEHFADRETMALKRDHAKLSGYFNFDNGSGKIRGVYLQGNDMMRPVFEAWLAPFKDLGATTITIANTSGTDHLGFDAVGLPGFQFIQDPLDYSTRTHHSNMDVYERIQPGDLMQASAIIASIVYHAATRPELLPRKPVPMPPPKPEPKKEDPKKT